MDSQEPSPKRPKKNKFKKIKSSISEDGSSNELLVVDETIASSSVPKIKSPASTPNPNNKKRKKRDSASSDEERWLTAIESGKLEDVDDELKKIKPKDPALMTARQRAMYDRVDGNASFTTPTLMSLPTGYKEKVMTAEAIQKAAIKSLKRKQLADEKREKDKKKTMERLLKKQDSKAAKAAKAKITKTSVPVIIYRQNCEISTISLPEGQDYPLKTDTIRQPPKPVPCAMGCGNFKKYSCSKTGTPLCSLECYKNNIANVIM